MVGGVAVGLIVLTVVATRYGPRWWKAAMFGTAAAISYAFTAALIKVVSDYAATNWVTLFVHWQTYGVIAFGLLGLFLTQNAFHAGPLAASQSTLVLVDPLVSISMGIALFGDSLRTSGPYGPLEAVSLLVMFMGAVFLSNSPLITGMKSEGKGVEYDEMLSRRLKHPHHAAQETVERQRVAALLVRLISRPCSHHEARHGGEVVRMRQVRTVLRVDDVVDDGTGDVGAQPLDRAAVVGRRRWAAPAEQRGHFQRGHVEGGAFDPHAAQVRHQGGAVGPPFGPALLGQAAPGAVAHHPGEEALRLLTGIVGHGGPRRLRPGGGSPATAWAARRRQWRRRPAARTARLRSRRCPPGCARRPTSGPAALRQRTSSAMESRSSTWPPMSTTPPAREPW